MIGSLMSPTRHRAAVLASTSGLIATSGFLAACGSTAAPGAGPARSVTSNPGAGSAGGTSKTATPAANTAATSTPTASAAPSGPAGCLASGLQAQLGTSEGAAGTIYQVIVLTNTTASDCTLSGFPGVSFVTGQGGSQVGAPATRNPAVKATRLTLAPGGKANALLAVHDAGAFPDCRLRSVDWLRIYPPGDYGSLYVQYKTQTCANAAKQILTVTAVSRGAGSAS